MVLSAYARRYKSGNVSVMTEVFVYATGVKMGHFNRSLFAVGCRVGRDVYEVYSRDTDVFVCVAPRAVKEEESVSVVLRDDAAARDLREGRTRKLTSGNATVEIQYVQGDLKELESEAEVKFDARWTGGYVEIRSDVTMQGGMDGDEGDAMRYDICLGTMLKPFTYMLGDWIDYHRRIGVDMVFVLDNHADTDLAEVYANRSDVEVGYWPWERAQDQGIGFLLVAGRARCKWMLLMDCDEYVLVGAGKNFRHAGKPLLKEYLKRVQTSPQMSFPYLTIGPSGHVYRPRVPVAEAYVYMHERQKRNGKVIAQTDFSWVESEVHKHRAREKSRKTERMQGNLYPEGMDEAPSLVHFQHRSLEERVMKREAGYASVTTRTRGDGRRRVLDVRNPPGFYKRKDEKMKYTYFRDMWRAVTKARGLREQRLVRAVGETECVVDVVLGEELPPLREGVCGA